MTDPEFYAAHREGEFQSAEAALAKAGVTSETIGFIVQNAKVNASPAIFCPINEDYGALVTQSGDRFLLWRGFYGFRGSQEHALDVIEQLKEGVPGEWAIFKWTKPASTTPRTDLLRYTS